MLRFISSAARQAAQPTARAASAIYHAHQPATAFFSTKQSSNPYEKAFKGMTPEEAEYKFMCLMHRPCDLTGTPVLVSEQAQNAIKSAYEDYCESIRSIDESQQPK